ncbi:MAG: endonuclease domain-containing protein [Pseudolabrys sp.]|nr:endonuclease domain-containing protein [Pseudolabrys sp.]
MPHAVVSPQKRRQAKTLRRGMTRAETLLWRYLKAHHLDGVQFRRQTPVGPYIADFCSHRMRLVVEVDGETHDFQDRHQRDAMRDRWFASQGYRVLRFTNDDVLRNLEGVIATVAGALPPSLSLPHKGGGNPKNSDGA